MCVLIYQELWISYTTDKNQESHAVIISDATKMWKKLWCKEQFLKISSYRKCRKICWTVFTLHIHKRAKYCVTLYCPDSAGTAYVILPTDIFGIERTSLWTNDGHLTVYAMLLATSRWSAGVTLPLEFRIGVGIVSENDIAIYCNISFKYCDILQYIEQVSRTRKTVHILLKSIKK